MALLTLQIILNLFLFFVFAWGYKMPGLVKRRKNHLFLLNLATSDIVGASITLSYMIFKALDHYRTDLSEVAGAMVEHCRWILVVFRYQYQSTILAVICLTLDRFLSIHTFLRYDIIMSWKKVWMMVAISWVIPLINSLFIFFFHSNDKKPGIRNENNFCSFPSHLDTKWWMMTDIVFVLMIICLFVLNVKVLLTYIKLKQRQYKIMNRNRRVTNLDIKYSRRLEIILFKKELHIINIPVKKENIVYKSQTDLSIEKEMNVFDPRASGVSRLLELIKSSSYVIVILCLFSICYLPGYALYFYDIFYDQLGYLHDHTHSICGQFNDTLAQSYRHDIVLGRCILKMFRNTTSSCLTSLPDQILQSSATLCATLYYRLHDHMFGNLVPIAMLLVAINSFSNPIIYLLWNREFRMLIGKLFNLRKT